MQRGLWCAETEMDEDNPEKAKAERAIQIIFVLMAVGTFLPFALFYLFRT